MSLRELQGEELCIKSVWTRNNARLNKEGLEESAVRSAHGIKGSAYKNRWGNNGRGYLADLDTDWKMILKWMLQIWGLKLWNGLNCSRICPVTGCSKEMIIVWVP